MSEDQYGLNYSLFRDCLSTALLQPAGTQPQLKGRRRSKTASRPGPESVQLQQDMDELADFIDWLANEIYQNLPEEIRTLDYRSWRESEDLQARFSLPITEDDLSDIDIPPPVRETLTTYSLISKDSSTPTNVTTSPEAFLAPILTTYVGDLATPPPSTPSTRTSACEICERSWVPLTYHHLIPRFVHQKAVKRGWHRAEDLQNVAWLCGACHAFVHRFRGHEELARSYYTVQLLLEAEEVRRFAGWVAKLRWKAGATRYYDSGVAAVDEPVHMILPRCHWRVEHCILQFRNPRNFACRV